jgi:glycerophosphoryl diester phosphodiesterase
VGDRYAGGKITAWLDREGSGEVVLVSAHRGGSEEAQPATYEAYEHALSSGAEYAEFDIRKTGDGVLVVYHDAHADHTGPAVASLSYGELCDRLGYSVPRVLDVMELLAGKLIGHLDLKEIGYEEEVVNAAIDAFGMDNFIATTLEDVSIENIKRMFPKVKTALSLGRDLKEFPRSQWAGIRRGELFPISRLRACGSDWVAVNYKLGRLGVIKTCKRNDIGIMVWTVNSDELIDQFLRDKRVDVLITNRPEYTVKRRAAIATEAASSGIVVPDAVAKSDG